MKKRKLKTLKLNKKSISNLEHNFVKGGIEWYTDNGACSLRGGCGAPTGEYCDTDDSYCHCV